MAEFHDVAKREDVPAGEGRAFLVGDRLIAVFFVDGQYTAVDDTCPHMGASLATGYVEKGGVMCPWHAWRFCVKSGEWLDNPGSKLRLRQYPVRVEGDMIQVSPEPLPET